MVDIEVTVHIISIRGIMRILNLTLIVTIMACYSGLCDTSHVTASSLDQEIEGCHSMGNHDNSSSENTILDYNNTSKDHSSCCLDTLTNGLDNIKNNSIVRLFTINPKYVITQYGPIKTSYFFREHDPPDLLALNSTFLI